jgi:microcystin-dependent protein
VPIPRHPDSAFFPGLSLVYWGSTLPPGFLWEDGASIAVATYPDLFDVIGYTYGGAGANFNVPDSQRRAIRGKGAGDNLGDSDGAVYANRIVSGVHGHLIDITSGSGNLSLIDHGQTQFAISLGSGFFVTTGYQHTSTDHEHQVTGAADNNVAADSPHIVANRIIKF